MQHSLSLTPDSKALSAETRQALWDAFDLHPPLCYSSATLSPQGISAGMLRRAPINLNQQAQVGLSLQSHLSWNLGKAYDKPKASGLMTRTQRSASFSPPSTETSPSER